MHQIGFSIIMCVHIVKLLFGVSVTSVDCRCLLEREEVVFPQHIAINIAVVTTHNEN